ncbi:MAG: hypothetical protein WAV95_08700 [Azonexus sp.]
MNDLLIPKINLVQMDRRASLASMIGMASFFGGMFLSLVVVTLFIQERNVHITGNGLALLYAACLVASGVLAYLLKKLIGGNRTEVENISAEFSDRTVRLGDALTIRTEDIRKVRIRRSQSGCIDVVLYLSNKGELRIDPVVSGSSDLNPRKLTHCQLCELIQAHLATRWRAKTAVPGISP